MLATTIDELIQIINTQLAYCDAEGMERFNGAHHVMTMEKMRSRISGLGDRFPGLIANGAPAEFGRTAGDLGPVYGYLWRSFGGDYPEKNGVDQIAKLLEQIRTNPDSRRLIVTGWDPRQADNVDLPPCHTLFQFKVENGRILHCQLYQRSADAFLGVPFNISSPSSATLHTATMRRWR